MSCPHGEWHDTDCEVCEQLDAKDKEIARLRENAKSWKREAEYQYLQLRICKYGPDQSTYPVEGALDAWYEN